MKQSNNDVFLLYISRFVIFLPIIIIIAALFLKIGENKSSKKAIKPSAVINEPKKVQTTFNKDFTSLKDIVPKQTSAAAGFDLKGPFVCEFTTQGASISAFIRDKKIYASVKGQENDSFLVSGDCFYRWEDLGNSGEKTCGVGNYLSLLEWLPKLGLFDFNSLLSYLPESNLKETGLSQELNNLDFNKICKKKVVEDKYFNIPKILFKEVKLEENIP